MRTSGRNREAATEGRKLTILPIYFSFPHFMAVVREDEDGRGAREGAE